MQSTPLTKKMPRSHQTEARSRDRLRRIEGRHNTLVKELRLAFTRAERTVDGNCAIEGLRIVEEATRSGLRFRAIFFRESAQDLATRLLPQIGAHVETLLLPDRLFDAAVPTESPQGVAALARWKEFSLDELFERLHVGPIVVVAGLQDPGNLGTIIRSSEAFGGAGVVLAEGTVSPFNSKVIRASAGSIFRLPVLMAKAFGGLETVSARFRAQSVRLVATSSHKGVPIEQVNLSTPVAIFVGNEGSGLPRNLLVQVDETVAIPHSPQVESLNAGIAASIVLYEAARQRKR